MISRYFILKRTKVFLVIVFALFLLQCSDESKKSVDISTQKESTKTSKKHFIVLGDTQKTSLWEKIVGRESNDAERELIINEIANSDPAFVIIVGDLVFDGSSETHWKDFDELIEPVASKNIPVYPVLGNHDYWGSNSSALKNFSERFEQFRTKHWYSQKFDSLGLIFLDSNIDELPASGWDEQKAWFGQKLDEFDKDSSITGVFIFLHHPPFTNSTVTSDELHIKKTFMPAYINSKKGLAMITGHAHGYERFFENGKTFIVSAGGGGPRVDLKDSPETRHKDKLINDPDTTAQRPFNFLVIERTGENVRIIVRGLLKNTNRFFDLEEFSLPIH
jgi:predicted MPP superfamily phosphohydrolase